jgi:hypothetical protein
MAYDVIFVATCARFGAIPEEVVKVTRFMTFSGTKPICCLSQFIETAQPSWKNGRVVGKVGSVAIGPRGQVRNFPFSGVKVSLNDEKESVAITLQNILIELGLCVVGLPYSLHCKLSAEDGFLSLLVFNVEISTESSQLKKAKRLGKHATRIGVALWKGKRVRNTESHSPYGQSSLVMEGDEEALEQQDGEETEEEREDTEEERTPYVPLSSRSSSKHKPFSSPSESHSSKLENVNRKSLQSDDSEPQLTVIPILERRTSGNSFQRVLERKGSSNTMATSSGLDTKGSDSSSVLERKGSSGRTDKPMVIPAILNSKPLTAPLPYLSSSIVSPPAQETKDFAERPLPPGLERKFSAERSLPLGLERKSSADRPLVERTAQGERPLPPDLERKNSRDRARSPPRKRSPTPTGPVSTMSPPVRHDDSPSATDATDATTKTVERPLPPGMGNRGAESFSSLASVSERKDSLPSLSSSPSAEKEVLPGGLERIESTERPLPPGLEKRAVPSALERKLLGERVLSHRLQKIPSNENLGPSLASEEKTALTHEKKPSSERTLPPGLVRKTSAEKVAPTSRLERKLSNETVPIPKRPVPHLIRRETSPQPPLPSLSSSPPTTMTKNSQEISSTGEINGTAERKISSVDDRTKIPSERPVLERKKSAERPMILNIARKGSAPALRGGEKPVPPLQAQGQRPIAELKGSTERRPPQRVPSGEKPIVALERKLSTEKPVVDIPALERKASARKLPIPPPLERTGSGNGFNSVKTLNSRYEQFCSHYCCCKR